MNTNDINEAVVAMEMAHDYLLENVNHMPAGALRIMTKLSQSTLPLTAELGRHPIEVKKEKEVSC